MAVRKLTLTMEPETIEMAKRYARKHNTSVSAVVSQFIRSVASEEEREDVQIPRGSLLEKVAGIIKLPEGKTVDDLLQEAIQEKHGVHK